MERATVFTIVFEGQHSGTTEGSEGDLVTKELDIARFDADELDEIEEIRRIVSELEEPQAPVFTST